MMITKTTLTPSFEFGEPNQEECGAIRSVPLDLIIQMPEFGSLGLHQRSHGVLRYRPGLTLIIVNGQTI